MAAAGFVHGGVVDRDFAVGGVDVAVHHVACGGVDGRRYVVVGVGRVIAGVVASVEQVAVAVAVAGFNDQRIDSRPSSPSPTSSKTCWRL